MAKVKARCGLVRTPWRRGRGGKIQPRTIGTVSQMLGAEEDGGRISQPDVSSWKVERGGGITLADAALAGLNNGGKEGLLWQLKTRAAGCSVGSRGNGGKQACRRGEKEGLFLEVLTRIYSDESVSLLPENIPGERKEGFVYRVMGGCHRGKILGGD